MKQGQVLVYDTFTIEVPLEAYRTAPGKEDALEYIGDNIPNDIEYDAENDVLYSAGDRPTPYHSFIKGVWVIKDKKGYKQYCMDKIDEAKAEVLAYGFDYNGHQQRCRDKDVAFMVATVMALQVAKQVLSQDKTVKWYYEDNYGEVMDLVAISKLMLYGMTFVQSVYDTENFFKSQEEPKLIDKKAFEAKRKEIHEGLVK